MRGGGLGGPAALDLAACADIAAAHGVERRAALVLLPYVEQGYCDAMSAAAETKEG